MSDFKSRLITEYRELYSKRQKLNKFLQDFPTEMPHDFKLENSLSLLIAQLYAMDTYIQILRLRFLELGISYNEFDGEIEDESKCN